MSPESSFECHLDGTLGMCLLSPCNVFGCDLHGILEYNYKERLSRNYLGSIPQTFILAKRHICQYMELHYHDASRRYHVCNYKIQK